MLARWPPLWRNLSLAAAIGLVAWFAWTVRGALNPLLVGLLLAYMLHPMVLQLERRGWSKTLAVNVIFVTAFLLVGLMAVALVWQGRMLWLDLTRESGALARIEQQVFEAGVRFQRLLHDWGLMAPPPAETAEPVVTAPGTELRALMGELVEWLRSDEGASEAGKAGLAAAGGALAVVRRLFGSLLTFLGWTVLVPIYTWFLLFELERIGRFVVPYVPREDRTRFQRIGSQTKEMLGNFFRGRVLVMLLKGLVLAGILAVAGVPYAFLLGILAGVLSIIPFAGPALGYGMAFLLSLLEHSVPGAAIRTAIVWSLGELIENYVLIPKIMGESLGLHPVVVIAAFMIFGSALGMFGLLLALPLTATVVILARELVLPMWREWAENRSPIAKPPDVA